MKHTTLHLLFIWLVIKIDNKKKVQYLHRPMHPQIIKHVFICCGVIPQLHCKGTTNFLTHKYSGLKFYFFKKKELPDDSQLVDQTHGGIGVEVNEFIPLFAFCGSFTLHLYVCMNQLAWLDYSTFVQIKP